MSRCVDTFRVEVAYDGFEITLVCECGTRETLDTLDQLFARRFRAFLRRHGVQERVCEAGWDRTRLARWRLLE